MKGTRHTPQSIKDIEMNHPTQAQHKGAPPCCQFAPALPTPCVLVPMSTCPHTPHARVNQKHTGALRALIGVVSNKPVYLVRMAAVGPQCLRDLGHVPPRRA